MNRSSVVSLYFVVKRGIDAVTDEHREADLLQRAGERLGEARLVGRIAAKERLEIESRDLIVIVELVGRMLREAIGVRLRHLVIFAESRG